MKSPLKLRLLLALLTDVKRLEPSLRGIDRDIITIKARFKHEGDGFLTVTLPKFCDALDRGLADSRFACPFGFRTVRRGTLPAFLQGLLCEVFEQTGSLKEDPNVRVIKCLREVLRLFKKVPSSTRDEVLGYRAIGTFWDTDDANGSALFDSRANLLSHVAGYVLPNLESTRFECILPQHGPGAVSEPLHGNQKWDYVATVLSKLTVDSGHWGLDIWDAGWFTDISRCASEGNSPRLQSRAKLSGALVPSILPSCELHDGLSSDSRYNPARSARLVTVPKDTSSRRTITVEPCWNMFIQQGLNKILRENIEKDPVLRNCLTLSDQTPNQKLALEGSINGRWATLDLKSASDLLSYELVQFVFTRISPSFCREVFGCRTSEVQNKYLRKFAGMGNALTFPVQSVVFALLAIAATASLGTKWPRYGDVVRASRDVRVYGDDIIVRSDVADLVVDWIESFGLKINRKKSFTTGNFRESCGVDAFKGVDVTPVYLRADPDDSSNDPAALASFVSTSNQLWLRGLYSAAKLLERHVEARIGYPLPLVAAESSGLGWVTRTGAVTVQKWDRNLHQWLVKAPVISPCKRGDSLSGYPALLKFFLAPEPSKIGSISISNRDKEHLKKTVIRFKTRIAARWIPARAGLASV